MVLSVDAAFVAFDEQAKRNREDANRQSMNHPVSSSTNGSETGNGRNSRKSPKLNKINKIQGNHQNSQKSHDSQKNHQKTR